MALLSYTGPVAQWIRHLTTNQGMPGSSPGGVAQVEFLFSLDNNRLCCRCFTDIARVIDDGLP